MSFGIGLGDLVRLSQLAWKIDSSFNRDRSLGPELSNFKSELTTLSALLDGIGRVSNRLSVVAIHGLAGHGLAGHHPMGSILGMKTQHREVSEVEASTLGALPRESTEPKRSTRMMAHGKGDAFYNKIIGYKNSMDPNELRITMPILRREPKAPLSMPLARIWRNVMDLLSFQNHKSAIPVLMLCVKPASADSCNSSERGQELTGASNNSLSTYYQFLLESTREVAGLWANSHDRDTHNSPTPQTLLLGCFLCTSLAVLMAYTNKNDRYQVHFLIINSMLCVGAGVFFAANVQDFVFRYLLLGVGSGLVLSALFHRGLAVHHNGSCRQLGREKPLIALWDEKTQGWGDEKIGRDGALM